jgi:ribose transport system permease protein
MSDGVLPTVGAEERGAVRLALVALTRFWIFLFLLGLVVYFWGSTPRHSFLEWQNVHQLFLNTSQVILLAIGETFVILTAGIDLSVGAILVFSGVAGGKVMLSLSGTPEQIANLQFPHAGLGIPFGILAALAAGTGWGLLNGVLVTRLKLPPFIVTLGTFGMAFGGADLLAGGTNISSVPPSIQDSLGNGKVFGLVFVPIVIAVGLVVVAHVMLRHTRFGQRTAAIGSNEDGARRTGINVDLHLIKVYTMTGFLCGLAGVIDLARYGTENLSSHQTDNLNAIAAVVIGGTSLFGGIATILGTVVGALIPAVLQNGLIINGIDPFWQEVLVGAVIIVAVYMDQLRRRRLSS